ncbi:alanine racemase [Lacimicrobium sp. SS2-24]|uniref:alanine racemase n=1 Tax=Lacimicrobium sp. SS2-24 TaxID=2005569 RepID=UPI000B4A97AF|nr:alanine racemase [Lacimicrobium sp. SS2-24]
MTYRPSFAEIDLGAIRENYRLSCQLAPNSQHLAVVKANAYGHDAIEVARILKGHAPALAVAFIDEALQLREAGIDSPILVLEGCFSANELILASQHNLWLMFHSVEQVIMLESTSLPTSITAWLKVDTGMHRLGIDAAQAPSVLQRLLDTQKLSQQPVLASHMANAEVLDHPLNRQQIEQVQQLGKQTGCALSLANSAALMQLPASRFDWNRPGIMLYGCSPLEKASQQIGLKPAMRVVSSIMAIRELHPGEAVGYGGHWVASQPSRIATVAIGYGDGYPRSTHGKSDVFLHGQRAKVVGSVSMDMIGVDISHIPQARIGDQVEIWGSHVRVNELAAQVNTISYELLTRISQRLPRRFIQP